MSNDKQNLTAFNGNSSHTERNNHTGSPEVEKSTVHIIVEIIEYAPNAVAKRWQKFYDDTKF